MNDRVYETKASPKTTDSQKNTQDTRGIRRTTHQEIAGLR